MTNNLNSWFFACNVIHSRIKINEKYLPRSFLRSYCWRCRLSNTRAPGLCAHQNVRILKNNLGLNFGELRMRAQKIHTILPGFCERSSIIFDFISFIINQIKSNEIKSNHIFYLCSLLWSAKMQQIFLWSV